MLCNYAFIIKRTCRRFKIIFYNRKVNLELWSVIVKILFDVTDNVDEHGIENALRKSGLIRSAFSSRIFMISSSLEPSHMISRFISSAPSSAP